MRDILLTFLLYVFPTLVALLLIFTGKITVNEAFGAVLPMTLAFLFFIGIPIHKDD